MGQPHWSIGVHIIVLVMLYSCCIHHSRGREAGFCDQRLTTSGWWTVCSCRSNLQKVLQNWHAFNTYYWQHSDVDQASWSGLDSAYSRLFSRLVCLEKFSVIKKGASFFPTRHEPLLIFSIDRQKLQNEWNTVKKFKCKEFMTATDTATKMSMSRPKMKDMI